MVIRSCKLLSFLLVAGLLLVHSIQVFAANTIATGSAEYEKIQSAVNQAIPGLKINKIMPAPLSGFYQVISGADVFYVSNDVEYILYGNLIDLKLDKKHWNVTETLRNSARKELIATFDQKDMIAFTPKSKVTGTIDVFTDVDCSFCQRFHKNIDEILSLGIEVRYLAFPRQGIGSESYKKSVSIWCADKKAEMLALAMTGGAVPDKQCNDGKVAAQFKLGQQLGVNGTPTIVFADGYMLASYLEPKELMQQVLEHVAQQQ